MSGMSAGSGRREDAAANLRDEADWCRRYDEAIQTCDLLLAERETADWHTDASNKEDQERRSRQVVSRVAAYTRTPGHHNDRGRGHG